MDGHLSGKSEVGTVGPKVLAVRTGPRNRPDDLKGRIVAQTLYPGAKVADVARRHGIGAQHLSTWRRLAREGKIVVPDDGLEDGPMFARVEIAPEEASAAGGEFVQIGFGKATIRLPGDASARRIADIAHARRDAR